MSGRDIVSDSTGSIDAVCEARNFMEDEAEQKMTKYLLIKHIWDKYGEEKANVLKVKVPEGFWFLWDRVFSQILSKASQTREKGGATSRSVARANSGITEDG